MTGKPETTADAALEADIILMSRLSRLEIARDRISALASMCRNEMQGRLEDEAHRKAFMTLGLIVGECESVR